MRSHKDVVGAETFLPATVVDAPWKPEPWMYLVKLPARTHEVKIVDGNIIIESDKHPTVRPV